MLFTTRDGIEVKLPNCKSELQGSSPSSAVRATQSHLGCLRKLLSRWNRRVLGKEIKMEGEKSMQGEKFWKKLVKF